MLNNLALTKIPAIPEILERRTQALSYYEEQGLPSAHLENWHYTRLGFVDDYEFSSLDSSDINLSEYQIPSLGENQIIFVDGRLQNISKNLVSGLSIQTMREALGNDEFKEKFLEHNSKEIDSITELNLALFDQGVFIQVKRDYLNDQVLHLIYIDTAQSQAKKYSMRNFVHLDTGAELDLVETYVSSEQSQNFYHLVNQFDLQANSRLKHSKNFNLSHQSRFLVLNQVWQKRDSYYRSFVFEKSSALLRNELLVYLQEAGAEAQLDGIYFSSEEHKVDNQICIEHQSPHCQSRQFYRGLLSDSSQSTFHGKVHVYPDAQKTSSEQLNQNLLLSDQARINAKPSLEIYADDVKCGHGVTSGQLNAEEIFYLKSRGLTEELAKSLLVYAFANEVIEKCPHDSLKGFLAHQLIVDLSLTGLQLED